jgi:sulfatase modifying factor 1
MLPPALRLLTVAASCLLVACDSAPPEPTPTGPKLAASGASLTASASATAEADPPPAPRRTDLQAGEMVRIPAGHFRMGAQSGEPDALPIHDVALDAFDIDVTEVTNDEMLRFVAATRYVTTAEKAPSPAQFPDVPKQFLKPGSLVMLPPSDGRAGTPIDWWRWVPGADFRHPEGPSTSIQDKEKHPVVHVSWDDAVAFCAWKGKRLPTEAEWEYAARGGLAEKSYTWGSTPQGPERWRANTWQGEFPFTNTREDGYRTTAPVGSFSPNGYGLYDMSGNVWEWVSDWYRPDTYSHSEPKNPQGPPNSLDPNEPGVPKRVQRGGSFLCADSYCVRYKAGGRGKSSPDSSHMHVGFRCAK